MAIVASQRPAHATAETIPLIDVGPYLGGASGALEATAAALREALEEVGFFVIVNHGIPEDLIARTFAEARRFHDRPLDWKMALRMNEPITYSDYLHWWYDANYDARKQEY
ncbi:MAG: 2-oxoglutarate and iron-dependent oxygenase domain-containing protein [Gammaproteobacteria bacterium]